jgi:hypothetical protein
MRGSDVFGRMFRKSGNRFSEQNMRKSKKHINPA